MDCFGRIGARCFVSLEGDPCTVDVACGRTWVRGLLLKGERANPVPQKGGGGHWGGDLGKVGGMLY